ncbi:hypothetical protein [Dyadobacter psychrophilus]|uniref:Uncharacterized protein n=1 Tax=Dyadobacter psychrophilus TaxID=651661 RepID=A0A1T5FT46_9BACT|nr:hypothetical protein [Dyadobacter psychrophilus]SKB99316.1 hypothetical protein SAMN05660293_03389 [Dyadobacter psychrophilus]
MKYTKAHLERIVFAQLDNIEAMNDLLITVKAQTEMIQKANKILEKEVEKFKVKKYEFVGRKKRGMKTF